MDPISEAKSEDTKEDVDGPEFDDEHIVDNAEATNTPTPETPAATGGESKSEGEKIEPKGELAKKTTNRKTTPEKKASIEDTIDGMTLA